ncbi:hypothetical protein G9A89_021849 [Geosiphon pyriformis]|nr:hypothetical protein G9A89_021849 [Geosiphon pyriformis]
MGACYNDDKEYSTNTLDDQNGKKNGTMILECEMTFLVKEKHAMLHVSTRSLSATGMAITKIEEAPPEEIREIKDNPPEPIKLDWDSEPVINLLDPEQFHEHYQELAPTKEEQDCASELESTFNPDSNSDNDNNENNSSSFTPNSNENYNDSNFDLNPKTFIAFSDLTKKQEFK